ncbi:DUF3396 domain-containing protein [Salmonella enterica]|nr:DUF3396 domain-containing protein [Salmonella enterica subsp. salamae]EHI7817668.1 DUF3396 domain-containing protein [Salmonella enterica]EHJ0755054.1 DUF3396 domain-containing protein [Salmonella enterica]HCL5285617.1 DUF3396 domain-containing protein [Salmonella enterica]
MEASQYFIKDNGEIVLSPAFCITLFTNTPVSRDKSPSGLLSPYHKILNDFDGEFLFANYDFDQQWPVKITKEILLSPDRWLSDPLSRSKDSNFIFLCNGESSRLHSLPFFYWYYSNVVNKYQSYYRLEVSLNWKNSLSANDIDDYIIQLIDEYPLVCGYAGYTISCDHGLMLGRIDLQQYIYHWYRRHPGFMNMYPASEVQSLSDGPVLCSIGWITLLGGELCSKMGGEAALREKLKDVSGIVIKSLPGNGVLIRIGERPQLGDVNKGDILDAYCAVGQILRPIAVDDFDKLADTVVVEGFYDKPESEQIDWLGRFFEKK